MVLPHNLYGLTKRWGEEVAQLYAPMDLVIWRPSMPYGPGAPPGRGRRALDNMLWQAHHRMPITVHKGAERSWCWLGDVVRGMRLTIEASQKNRASSNILDHQPIAYNIGRDDDPLDAGCRQWRARSLEPLEDLIRLVEPPQRQTVVKRLSPIACARSGGSRGRAGRRHAAGLRVGQAVQREGRAWSREYRAKDLDRLSQPSRAARIIYTAASTPTSIARTPIELIVIKNEPTCGIAWQKGAEQATGDFLHFTADDLEPALGWDLRSPPCEPLGRHHPDAHDLRP
jgi:hypothetical protein